MQVSLSDLTNELVMIEDQVKSLELRRQSIMELFRQYGNTVQQNRIAELSKRADAGGANAKDANRDNIKKELEKPVIMTGTQAGAVSDAVPGDSPPRAVSETQSKST